MPQACQQACEMQYSHCMETYARGCHSNGQSLGEDYGKGREREKRKSAPRHYFELARGGDTIGAFGNDKSRQGHSRWDCDGDEAEAACLHQFNGCKDLNRSLQKPKDKCERFGRNGY